MQIVMVGAILLLFHGGFDLLHPSVVLQRVDMVSSLLGWHWERGELHV